MALTEEEARAQAEAEVRAYCGWHITPLVTETLTVDGSGNRSQMLPTLHLVNVTAVTDGDTVLTVGLGPSSDVEWSHNGYLRFNTWQHHRKFTERLQGVTADVVHGYADWPLDVLAVVRRLTQRALDSDEAGTLAQVGQVRYATGSDGLPATGTLTDLDRNVLDRYRLPPWP